MKIGGIILAVLAALALLGGAFLLGVKQGPERQGPDDRGPGESDRIGSYQDPHAAPADVIDFAEDDQDGARRAQRQRLQSAVGQIEDPSARVLKQAKEEAEAARQARDSAETQALIGTSWDIDGKRVEFGKDGVLTIDGKNGGQWRVWRGLLHSGGGGMRLPALKAEAGKLMTEGGSPIASLGAARMDGDQLLDAEGKVVMKLGDRAASPRGQGAGTYEPPARGTGARSEDDQPTAADSADVEAVREAIPHLGPAGVEPRDEPGTEEPAADAPPDDGK